MAFMLRRLVSTNKRRYQEDGYDLDLSYITPRIIAMGFPCNDISSLYRNPSNAVVRLLEERHKGRYKVYNLCVERGYDTRTFSGRVMRVPLYDGQAPPLHLVLEICRDATAWLGADPSHVVVVHCKAGKGRTGVVVCALLLAMDQELGPASLERTLALWAERRTQDRKGLSIPSQRRFVGHFHQLLLDARHNCVTGGSQCPGKLEELKAQLQRNPGQRQLAEGQIPIVLATADIPQRSIKLLRLRFRGLPEWLLQNCTVSVWWRPVGHYEPLPMCHVHTRTQGCAGCYSHVSAVHHVPNAFDAGSPTAIQVIRRQQLGNDISSNGNGPSGISRRQRDQELVIEFDRLPPLQSPPPPSALPYYSPSVPPRNDQWGMAGYSASTAPAAAVTGTTAAGTRSQTEVGPAAPLELDIGSCRPRTPAVDRCGTTSGDAKTRTSPGRPAPVVGGDIKIQIFRGYIANPPHDIFKGSVSQFTAWICTSYLDPNSSSLELGRRELDKLSKRLRRWKGPVGLMLEYESQSV